jgi:AAA15 family ATPase/GTPase
MIIKKIEIENYRNFDKASAEFSKFNVLIGKNGTGKSNFMNAIMLPLRATTLNGNHFDSKMDKRNIEADTMIKVWPDLSQEESTSIIPDNSGSTAPRLFYQFLSQGKKTNLSVRIDQTDTSSNSTNFTSSILTFAGQNIELQSEIGRNGSDLLEGTFIYPLPDSREMPVAFQPGMPMIISSFDFGDALLRMKLNFRDKYDNLIKEIKKISPEILEIPVDIKGVNAWEIQFKEEYISRMLGVQGISKGTRDIVMMLIILEFSRGRSIILIEEPEVHLYPLAVKRLREIMLQYIEDKDLQIIISTHNVDFLMDLDPTQNKDVKFFEFDKIKGASSIRELTEDKEIAEMIERMSMSSKL